jgi:hypothetical protein
MPSPDDALAGLAAADGQLAFEDEQLLAAIAWREKNPAGWQFLVDLALADVENGARPCIDLYFNILRRPHFAELLGLQRCSASVLIDNNLRAELARLLKREYGFEFSLRKSRGDPKEAA